MSDDVLLHEGVVLEAVRFEQRIGHPSKDGALAFGCEETSSHLDGNGHVGLLSVQRSHVYIPVGIHRQEALRLTANRGRIPTLARGWSQEIPAATGPDAEVID